MELHKHSVLFHNTCESLIFLTDENKIKTIYSLKENYTYHSYFKVNHTSNFFSRHGEKFSHIIKKYKTIKIGL